MNINSCKNNKSKNKMHYLLMYIENSSNLLLHFLLKYLANRKSLLYFRTFSRSTVFFNSRSYKNDLNTCIITNYTYFINTKLRSTRKITAKYPNYPTNYQNDILSVQEKKDDPSNLCKTIYANTIYHSIFIV